MAPAKVEAIQKLPRPYNVPELQRVLGMSNFVQKFTLGLADQTRALRELLKKDNQWTCGDAQECAFAQLKKQLSSPPGKRGGGRFQVGDNLVSRRRTPPRFWECLRTRLEHQVGAFRPLIATPLGRY